MRWMHVVDTCHNVDMDACSHNVEMDACQC